MGFFDQLPYTNFHELNLTELIKRVEELAREMHEFKVINKISYGGDWDITKQYPAWTVVCVNGTEGYISIRPVPIGIDYTNNDYWRLVADFSVQLADLGNRVADLESEDVIINGKITMINNNITTINNDLLHSKRWSDRRVLWVGDSYGNGWDGSQSITDPYTIASGYLGCSFENISHGGCRFGTAGTDPQYKYRTYIQNYINNHTDMNTFTDVIIVGGANDIIFNPSDDISTEFNTTINLVKANFPNALIRVGMIGRLSQTGATNCTFGNMRTMRDNYRNNAIANGVEYIAYSDLINHNYNLLASDGIHLSNYSDMGKKLAELLMNGDFGRDPKITEHIIPCTTTDNDNLAPAICTLNGTIYNGSLMTLRCDDLQFIFTPAKQLTWGKAYKFAKISGDVNTRGGISAIGEDQKIQIMGNVNYTYNGVTYDNVTPFIIQLYNDYLYITFKGALPYNNGTLLNPTINYINIRGGFNMSIDENNC